MKAILGIAAFVLAIWLAVCLLAGQAEAYGWQTWYYNWNSYYVPSYYWFDQSYFYNQNVYQTHQNLWYITNRW